MKEGGFIAIVTVALCVHIQFSTMDYYFQNLCYINNVLILDPIIQPRSFGGHCTPKECVDTETLLIISVSH